MCQKDRFSVFLVQQYKGASSGLFLGGVKALSCQPG